MKRVLDIVVSLVGLVLVAPLLFLVALIIKADSRGPVFFTQERIGRRFRPFRIYKFRTLIHEASGNGLSLTVANDQRITRVGRLLRRTKIDELPQLINVLKGDMSLVGPRPEIRQFVELFRNDYEEILKIRPGITDLASLKYHNESEILGQSNDPEEEYLKRVLPDKIRMARDYVDHCSLLLDLRLIIKTLPKLLAIKFAVPSGLSDRRCDNSRSKSNS